MCGGVRVRCGCGRKIMMWGEVRCGEFFLKNCEVRWGCGNLYIFLTLFTNSRNHWQNKKVLGWLKWIHILKKLFNYMKVWKRKVLLTKHHWDLLRFQVHRTEDCNIKKETKVVANILVNFSHILNSVPQKMKISQLL